MASEINRLIDKASMYVGIGRYEQAITLYEEVIRQEPSNADCWYGIGRIHLVIPPEQKAIECFQKAIQLDPTYAGAYHGMGIMLMRNGKYQPALASVEKAIGLQNLGATDEARVHNTRGNILRYLKRRTDAREAYKKAMALHPDYALPYNGLGNMYLDDKKYERAIALYLRVTNTSGVTDHIKAVSHYNLGRVYRQQKKYDLAIQHMGLATTLDPYEQSYGPLVDSYKEEKQQAERGSFGRYIATAARFVRQFLK